MIFTQWSRKESIWGQRSTSGQKWCWFILVKMSCLEPQLQLASHLTNFTVICSHPLRPTWFLHQPNRWVKQSLNRNGRLYIVQIFDSGTNFWNSLRNVSLPLVCYFGDGEVSVQSFPFGPSTPKSSHSMSQEISSGDSDSLWSHWIHWD